MSDRRIVVVRHGVTDWNREGRFQGHLDPPLSDVGRREAAMIGARELLEEGTSTYLHIRLKAADRASLG